VVAAAKLLRHVGRKRTGLFLAEGANMVEAALARGLVTDVFATESAASRFEQLLGSTHVHLVTEKAAKSLSDTVTPVGLVAVCSPIRLDSSRLPSRPPNRVMRER
jgi:TrmH family RNA methyltransferase